MKNLISVIETKINKRNAKFLISAFYDKKPSETILKYFKEDLFDATSTKDEVRDCVNMILASDYYSAVCSYNLDLYDVFSKLLMLDDNLHIVIPDILNHIPDLLLLWNNFGKGRHNDVSNRVSFYSKNEQIEDNPYTVMALQIHNHLVTDNCNKVCNLILDVNGNTKEEIGESVFNHSPVCNMIYKKIDYSNINLNWYFRHVGIFVNI